MISFVLDALLIIICVVTVFVSVKRGFVKTVLSLLSSVAAIFISVAFTPMVSSFIYDKFMLSAITNGIYDTVKSLAGNGTSEGISNMFETMPEALANLLERYNVGEDAINSMTDSAISGSADIQSICETIASPIATTISNALAFIACFIVAIIVLKILVSIIDAIFKLPVLNSINRTAGLILGLVLAVVVIFVYSVAVTYLVTSLGAISPEFFGEKVINDTVIIKFFSENNIFGLIENVIKSL